jgi:DNA-binding XRE family transcriptional regulator
LPYVVIRRWVSIKICRFRKIPYRDPDYPSYAGFLLKEWRNKHGFTLKEAADVLEMSNTNYRDGEYGYCQPDFKHWEIIVKKHLRGEIVYTKSNNNKGNA